MKIKIINNDQLQNQKIFIVSGEGEQGTPERYYGKKTIRALKYRLTKERCKGDRWAVAKIKTETDYGDDFLELDLDD